MCSFKRILAKEQHQLKISFSTMRDLTWRSIVIRNEGRRHFVSSLTFMLKACNNAKIISWTKKVNSKSFVTLSSQLDPANSGTIGNNASQNLRENLENTQTFFRNLKILVQIYEPLLLKKIRIRRGGVRKQFSHKHVFPAFKKGDSGRYYV